MTEEKLIAIGLTITVLLLSGCVGDRTGFEESKASYDNLILINGYKIYGHSSDFLCCVEDRYMVSYLIGHPNATTMLWLHDFIYCSDTDELFYYGNSEYIKEIIN